MPLNVDKISTGALSVNGTDITGNAPYKVYTALLTQNGGDSDAGLIDNGIVVGVTYRITPYGNEIGVDFTNIGAPNNNAGTYFVATGITPNSWGINTNDSWVLQYNTGAPVVTILENTIGDITWTYESVGTYYANSNNLFNSKIVISPYVYYNNEIDANVELTSNPNYNTNNILQFYCRSLNTGIDGQLSNVPIEIRVYN